MRKIRHSVIAGRQRGLPTHITVYSHRQNVSVCVCPVPRAIKILSKVTIYVYIQQYFET